MSFSSTWATPWCPVALLLGFILGWRKRRRFGRHPVTLALTQAAFYSWDSP
jgi:hypothetical protein